MKTYVIWQEVPSGELNYFIMDGDQSKFDGIYINEYSEKDGVVNLQDELCDIVYGPNKPKMYDSFPTQEFITDIKHDITEDFGAPIVITAGFIG